MYSLFSFNIYIYICIISLLSHLRCFVWPVALCVSISMFVILCSFYLWHLYYHSHMYILFMLSLVSLVLCRCHVFVALLSISLCIYLTLSISALSLSLLKPSLVNMYRSLLCAGAHHCPMCVCLSVVYIYMWLELVGVYSVLCSAGLCGAYYHHADA